VRRSLPARVRAWVDRRVCTLYPCWGGGASSGGSVSVSCAGAAHISRKAGEGLQHSAWLYTFGRSTGPVIQLAPLGLGPLDLDLDLESMGFGPARVLEYTFSSHSVSLVKPRTRRTSDQEQSGCDASPVSSISRLSGLVCKERQYAQGGWLAARDRYERFGVEAAEGWSTPGPHGRCGGWGTLATGPHYKISSCVCRSSTDTDVSHTICSS
jgi:hypothetical protein